MVANYFGNDEKARAFSEASGVPAYKFDVGSLDACREGVRLIEEAVGPVEVLVNNAGVTRDNRMLRATEEDWDIVLDTNLKSVFNFCKAVYRPMMKQRSGRIINISSVAAWSSA